jgi:hypothetical protein
MIESFIEGRIRLRSPLLSDPDLVERVRSALSRIDGVEKIEINPQTMGLLLEYDKSRLPLSFLMRVAPLFNRMDAVAKLAAGQRPAALQELIDELLERYLEFIDGREGDWQGL